MKTILLTCFATALLGVMSLAPVILSAKGSSEAVQLRVEFDRPVLPADSTERAVVKIALDSLRLPRGEKRPPVNLCLVIDRSGSMGGDKIKQARAAAIEAVRRLSSTDIFSLVAYDNTIETLVPACFVGDGAELEAKIRSITANGGTALYGGVVQGAAELRKHIEDRRYIHRLILLSDGQANVGPSSPDDLARLGRSLIQEGVSVTTIGVGTDFNEDLMTRLAQTSDGNTYFVASSADLPRIFNTELGDVLSVVARSVVLTIEFPEGVRPLSLVGREGTIRGQRAEVSINQLYAGQQKFALVEVEVASAKAGVEREVARASLRYDDAISQRAVVVTSIGKVRFTNARTEVISSANLTVQTDYARNVSALSKDTAVELVDGGRREDAARQLRARNEELKQMATVYKNVEVQNLVRDNAAEADRLEKSGLDNVSRKIYRAESAQTKSQQSSRN